MILRATRLLVFIFLIVWGTRVDVDGQTCFPFHVIRTAVNISDLERKVKVYQNSLYVKQFYKIEADNPFLSSYRNVCGGGMSNNPIVSGTIAKPNAWPWQALIRIWKGSKEYMCGGTLISNAWVLTAAHCVRGRGKDTLKYVQVVLGLHDLTRMKYANVLDISSTEDIYVHEDYDEWDNKSPDIALIKLPHAIGFTVKIRPACLPMDLDMRRSRTCIALGWGNVKNDKARSISRQLKQLTVLMSQCFHTFDIYFFCVWSAESVPSGVCYGDSGGPLLCKEFGHYFTFGVVSHGTTCDQSSHNMHNRPVKFTKVATFLEWMQNIILDSKNKFP